ncbi:thioredoxin [Thioalkalivibrio denitrificans]|uniref:Thioredoxin n=1 Tax=Thioalkalivibrio denitrificans TaxID=108003 RepID=A0A1V3NDY0_9GAMM|nr:TlpA disulfide reductase family protein [Thioalkalivibrio denitrificans]OOG23204.1 thioredoxin [Thioalkalivibrio denitrificans]
MTQPVFLAILVLVATLAGMAGFGFYHFTGAPEAAPPTAPSLASHLNEIKGSQRPDFSLPDLDGDIRHISEWDGDVVLINFWATWCPPCIREMPAFVEVQETYGEQGVTIVAVAIDNEQDVRDFYETYGLNFPVLLGETAGIAVSRDYGNRIGALPYSVLLDREGIIRFVKPGELHQETLEDELRPLL